MESRILLLALLTLLYIDGREGRSGPYRNGNHPKRAQDELLMTNTSGHTELDTDSLELEQISDILKQLSDVLGKIASRHKSESSSATSNYNQEDHKLIKTQSSASQLDSKSGDASSDRIREELSRKLKAALAGDNGAIINPDKNAVPRRNAIDPQPRTQTNTQSADDDRKFKRVLTKWMERELNMES